MLSDPFPPAPFPPTQVSDISSLDDNSKILFFTNLYNIMMGASSLFCPCGSVHLTHTSPVSVVHSILSKGSVSGLYDKGNLMKTTKYNVNGVIFNLLEVSSLPLRLCLYAYSHSQIEHNVLRAQSSAPSSVLGQLIISSEKSIYAVQRPMYLSHSPSSHLLSSLSLPL
jgi:hypothetical protein